VFNRVKSIAATSSTQVTITLKQPDYWLEGELASMPGMIIEKSFAQKQGKNYGTPAGSIMCTSAYMFKSWSPGVGVVAVRNPHYWNPSVHPMIGQITLRGVPDISSFTSGMLTGAIQGSYYFGVSTLNQLKNSREKLTVQQFPWIPNVQPTARLMLGKGLTGAVSSFAYMFAPWADSLGGSG